MSEITFLKSALFILFFMLCVLTYGINEMWKELEELKADRQADFDFLSGENTEREIDINIVCEHIGVDYYKDIRGKSEWFLSDIRNG